MGSDRDRARILIGRGNEDEALPVYWLTDWAGLVRVKLCERVRANCENQVARRTVYSLLTHLDAAASIVLSCRIVLFPQLGISETRVENSQSRRGE